MASGAAIAKRYPTYEGSGPVVGPSTNASVVFEWRVADPSTSNKQNPGSANCRHIVDTLSSSGLRGSWGYPTPTVSIPIHLVELNDPPDKTLHFHLITHAFTAGHPVAGNLFSAMA